MDEGMREKISQNLCVTCPVTPAPGSPGPKQSVTVSRLHPVLSEFDLLEILLPSGGAMVGRAPIDAFEPELHLVRCGCEAGCSRCHGTGEIDETDYSDWEIGDEGDDDGE